MTQRPASALVDGGPRTDRVGVLLVGHGTRSQQGIDEFLALARLVRERLAPLVVEPACLELCQPTIADGLARLVHQEVERVIVVPLLLFAAGHAKGDIPRAVGAAIESIGASRIAVDWAAHLGCHSAIVQLSERRFTESLHGRAPGLRERTALLLVGRGSHDPSATDEMHEFARLRKAHSPAGTNEVAFLAMAEPKVPAVLSRLAAANYCRVIAQPHLLFHGELLERLHANVQTCQAAHADKEWIVAQHLAQGLGCGSPQDELLATSVLDRVAAARIRVVAGNRGG